MSSFESFSPNAHVKLYPLVPAINNEQAQALEAGIQKLLRQFEREQATQAADCAVVENGAVLIIVHESGNEGDLSGCRKDKIAKVINHFEQTFGITVLSAPPMLIRVDGKWQACDRAALKALAAEQKLNTELTAYNLRCERLSQWRQQAQTAIKDMWMAPIVERILA